MAASSEEDSQYSTESGSGSEDYELDGGLRTVLLWEPQDRHLCVALRQSMQTKYNAEVKYKVGATCNAGIAEACCGNGVHKSALSGVDQAAAHAHCLLARCGAGCAKHGDWQPPRAWLTVQDVPDQPSLAAGAAAAACARACIHNCRLSHMRGRILRHATLDICYVLQAVVQFTMRMRV
jgi:hypothetical protein